MISPMYRYRATVAEVHDGDTYTLLIDVGFHTFVKESIRIRGVNTPENSTLEGKEVTRLVQAFLPVGSEVMVETFKTKKGTDARSFARYVADVWLPAGVLVADVLVERGWATRV